MGGNNHSKENGTVSTADLEKSVLRLEVNYRGIFQKSLAYRITNDLVYAAHSEGKTAFSNGRYSDDPQRNGVPCANFAFFSDKLSEDDLEAVASASMDIDRANVVVVLDDTMVKGLEPWGHYGIRPINEKVIAGGTLLVISRRKPEELIKHLEKKPFNYTVYVLFEATIIAYTYSWLREKGLLSGNHLVTTWPPVAYPAPEPKPPMAA